MTDIIIYNTPDGKSSIALYAKDGSVWLNQSELAELFATSKPNISMHITNILKDNELDANSVIKQYLTTATDGRNYKVEFYSLEMIMAIGFRVRGTRGIQFRQWANRHLSEYLRKGFIMDDERLKEPSGRADYFDELLNRIRDIRASEKRFYQKVRDLLALSSDYDKTDKATQMFFAETQNKLLFAVTGNTAAEIIVQRADPQKENMGLTTWKGNIVRKQDIIIAKNYLSENEIDTLNRLIMIFLETAELTVKERKDLTISFWKENVDRLLNFQHKNILQGTGSISHAQMEIIVEQVYEKFDQQRKKHDAAISDKNDLEEITTIERNIKKLKKK